VDTLLRKAGLTQSDVKMVNFSPPGAIGALERGDIDVTVAAEPWIARLGKAGNAVVWIPIRQVFPVLEHAFILYGPNLLEKNPEVGERFMIAYLKGVRQANQGETSRNLEIVISSTRLDRELLQEVCWRKFRQDGRVDTEALLEFQNWGIQKGLLDRKVPVDQFWEPRFIEHANKVLGQP
jgi:NitT/TauT family transport system substrate-binding protein